MEEILGGMSMGVYFSRSESETLLWAENFAKTLQNGDVVLLFGNMGAGKTVLCKGIARGLGIRAEITSPTFAYVNAYEDRLYHFDCYRIQSERQAFELGLCDYFDMGGICLIEWSENIAALLPENCKRVTISGSGDDVREIKF